MLKKDWSTFLEGEGKGERLHYIVLEEQKGLKIVLHSSSGRVGFEICC